MNNNNNTNTNNFTFANHSLTHFEEDSPLDNPVLMNRKRHAEEEYMQGVQKRCAKQCFWASKHYGKGLALMQASDAEFDAANKECHAKRLELEAQQQQKQQQKQQKRAAADCAGGAGGDANTDAAADDADDDDDGAYDEDDVVFMKAITAIGKKCWEQCSKASKNYGEGVAMMEAADAEFKAANEACHAKRLELEKTSATNPVTYMAFGIGGDGDGVVRLAMNVESSKNSALWLMRSEYDALKLWVRPFDDDDQDTGGGDGIWCFSEAIGNKYRVCIKPVEGTETFDGGWLQQRRHKFFHAYVRLC
jgi:hypothetical protein